jgi:hypothetical protein
MKMGSRVITVATVLFVLAAPRAFARSQQHSDLDSQEMTITNSPSGELIVAPPITTPASSVYDTPKPRPPHVAPPIPLVADKTDSSVSVEAGDENKTSTDPAANTEAVDGAKIDGATIDGATKPETPGGEHSAAVTALLGSAQSKEVAGPRPPVRTPGAVLFDQTHDDSGLDPLSWSVNVFKARHELAVYYKGRLFKRYDAVFGRNLDNGAKQWAQDRRTPEGVYCILEKYPSTRFHWFMRLNYPNLVDRVRYETLRINGVVPVGQDGKAPEVGSAIGIHGTDVPVLNAGHINWTTGCISLSNKDIDDLERLLPVGTVVIIKP